MRLTDAFRDVTLDVFNHHNRVIHHQSGGQCDSKKCQRVDRKSQGFHKDKSADQRNRYCDRWNESASPVLQKHVNHDNHEDDRFSQCLQHVANRFADHGCGIERDRHF